MVTLYWIQHEMTFTTHLTSVIYVSVKQGRTSGSPIGKWLDREKNEARDMNVGSIFITKVMFLFPQKQ